MLKKKNSKRPSDYQTLRIRIPPEKSMDKIMKDVQKVRTQLNKKRNPDEEKIWMQNHVLLEAIQLGLDALHEKAKHGL
jgi:hypothetical protein